MKSLIQTSAACLVVVCAVLANSAQASPLFSIGEGATTSWTEAMTAGNVVPVMAADGMTQNEADFYANEAKINGHAGFELRDAYLTPDIAVSDGFNTHQAMVMAWAQGGSAGNDVGDVAAWEYVYDIDPDLTNTVLEFSLLGSAVWDVSVELIDINGRIRSWFRVGPAPTWVNERIYLDSSAFLQNGFMLMNDPLFDITMVTTIRFDESGIWSMPFPVPPSGIITPPPFPPPAPPSPGWNAWNHVRVIPEPSSLALAGMAMLGGALALGLRRRRPR